MMKICSACYVLAAFLFLLVTPSANALDPILKTLDENRLAEEFLLEPTVLEPELSLENKFRDVALIKSVIVRFGGKPTSIIMPNRVYSVEVLAEHPEGLPLDIAWHLAIGAGVLEKTGSTTAVWTTGKASSSRDLRIEVAAEDTGTDSAGLSISQTDHLVFAGRVLDASGRPVGDANVTVNGTLARSNSDGRFQLTVPENPEERFIVNVYRNGYQLSSTIARKPGRDMEIVLDEATAETFDPSQLIVVSSPPLSVAGCRGSLSAGTDWTRFPDQREVNFIQPDGSLTKGASPRLQSLISIVEAGLGCETVFSVAIPPDSLVDQNGNPPTGPVNVAIAAIHHSAPGTMPGDYSVNDSSGPAAMFTVGAGSIEIFGNGNRYNLRPGAEAEISIRVASIMREVLGGGLEPTIPLLVYNRKTGLWDIEGQFQLTGADDTYVATVTHFSTFNADIVKKDPSCIRIESRGIRGNYRLEYSGFAPNGAAFVRTVSVDNVSSRDHVIHNLPNNTEILLRPFRAAGNPLATFAVNSGAPQSPKTPNPPAKPYTACKAVAPLFEVTNPNATPAVPTSVSGRWQDPLRSRLAVNWRHDGKNLSHFDIYIAYGAQKPGNFTRLGLVAANKRSEPIDYLVKPCTTSWLAVVAVNGNRQSKLSVPLRAVQDTTAIITTTTRINTPPMSTGTFKIGCTKPKPGALSAGAAILNRTPSDQIIDTAAGDSRVLFPRFQGIQNGRTRLFAGKRYDTGSNLAIYAQFNTWISVKKNEYLVAFTDGTKQINSVIAGDLDDPAPSAVGGTVAGSVMAAIPDKDPNKNIGGITPRAPWGGFNPTAAGPGYVYGEFDTNVFQPKNINLPAAVLAGMGFNVKFYMPLYYDDKF